MSLIRTRLAFERTLMAWIRTGVSLITFGFTLYKALQYLEEHGDPGVRRSSTLGSAHGFTVVIIGVGVVAIVLALVQHRRHVAVLRELDAELPILSVGLVVAVSFAAVGMWVFVEALLRL